MICTLNSLQQCIPVSSVQFSIKWWGKTPNCFVHWHQLEMSKWKRSSTLPVAIGEESYPAFEVNLTVFTMHTPQFSSLQQAQHMHKAASMSSLVSQGYMPPGHGYVPRKQKPSKPYGLSFTTTMNRTHRGPGRKYLIYAVITACVGLLFFMGGALYFGHRNVSR